MNLLQTFSLTNATAVKKIASHFAKNDNWHNVDIKTSNLGYGWIHYALIRNLQPEHVLCIGSRYGFIPAICALACKDNQKGSVDFVDAGYNLYNPKDKNHWGGVGYWHTREGKAAFNKFNLEKYIRLFVTTTTRYKKEFPNKTWSYIYIDGDHSYAGVKRDFSYFWPSLTNGGYVLLHDIYTKDLGGLNYGVKRFWNLLRKSKKYNCFEIPGDIGLGIIQK